MDYNKADWEGIRDALGRVEWDERITDNATTEENLETFTTILESACKGIPTRKPMSELDMVPIEEQGIVTHFIIAIKIRIKISKINY